MNISWNGVAFINCTAIATFVDWESNGILIDRLQNRGFDRAPTVALNITQNLRMSTLKVVGSSNSSNVSVVCVALLYNPNTALVEVKKR